MTNPHQTRSVCICVSGDIGHSPRMQYHSLSLAEVGYHVDIVADQESRPHEKLLSNPRIRIHPLSSYQSIRCFPRIINYFFKILFNTIFLLWNLMLIPRPDYILVQNPPSVPTLAIVWFVCRIRSCKFIIDWHNYGHTIMALSLGAKHPLVRLYSRIEFNFGKRSDYSFCVTRAMKDDLRERTGKKAIVLYDRPYSFFQPITSIEEKHLFLVKLKSEYSQLEYHGQNETLFTRYSFKNDEYQMKSNRPIILISSTSWTKDEDFQILLDALYEFDQNYANKVIGTDNDLKIVCFITGKGPMKSYYIRMVEKSYSFRHTRFVFPWLSAEDYPKLLACADLGICLHKSSSGLDLPMKVLDMFGARLPVCAYHYKSISELVIEDQYGLLFNDSASLVQCLMRLLQDFPTCLQLKRMQTNIDSSFDGNDWHSNWKLNALPVFK
ncbi:ALG1, chitobiosyldiphosphodolichol beta-mannosyltransferase isoform X2 [Dermatophagoides farinae]|uniref:Chitobiosyldiphosphodolichol beta-mannosyltransferase-like protein n=1 Tax=Dermatophagoides farinae TaxID=6954 RepID=A0A9D4SIS2_DERFA|nr:chitobiosyldiphosphodolichol beta-mannosyltransferase-like isoform X2 [Dermatophagoides farinae]KAH7643103.1 chitobiosyldiphosphodolichol beta-mannosyltransferase-like protein [Dermatophagoides farinae]